jgi:2'-5' RNA ligase
MPTLYLTLRFDTALEAAVRRLWLHIAEEKIEVEKLGGHRPHITLAAYEADDVAAYATALDAFTRTVAPFPVVLSHLGIFPEKRVLFLAPTPNEALFDLHGKLIAHTRRPLVHAEHLAADHWVPHCTLVAGAGSSAMAEIVGLCLREWASLEGMAEGIGILIPPDMMDMHDSSLRG